MKLMYLATDEYADWIPCPAIDMPRSQERWQASGVFANGGGWVRRSAAGHRVYDMSWNLMPASEIARIRAFFDGVYGSGPFYFIDPSAERTNVFPAAWATPRLAVEGGPSLIYERIPTLADGAAPNSTYPAVGAGYELFGQEIMNTLKIPVPDGHRFHFRASYESPTNATLSYRQGTGNWSAIGSGQRSVTGASWVEFSLRGMGSINLYWMQGVILPIREGTPRFQDFHPGQGNSGVDFEDFQEHTHSVGADLYGASVRLREVGSWL